MARSKKRAARSRKRAKAPSALKGRSLLIVDDDEAFADSLRRWAERMGAKVTVARQGREALERLQRAEYDALIVDLRMPEMDGYELHLRLGIERPETLRRAVFVTGDVANPETTDFIARSGCPCLAKPFEFEELAKALQPLL